MSSPHVQTINAMLNADADAESSVDWTAVPTWPAGLPDHWSSTAAGASGISGDSRYLATASNPTDQPCHARSCHNISHMRCACSLFIDAAAAAGLDVCGDPFDTLLRRSHSAVASLIVLYCIASIVFPAPFRRINFVVNLVYI